MNTAKEQQIVPSRSIQGEGVGVDPVVDGSEIVEVGMAVGVANGDVAASSVVLLENRQDARRRKPVNGGEHRGGYQLGIGQWEEVEAVVNEVELGGPLEHLGDVQALGALGFGVGIPVVPVWDHR